MDANKIEVLVNTYSDVLFIEAEAQKVFADAQALTSYRRDEAALAAYQDGTITGGNERSRKLQEIMIVADDLAAAHLEAYENKALMGLVMATCERKRVEAEIGLTKALLYSQARLDGR